MIAEDKNKCQLQQKKDRAPCDKFIGLDLSAQGLRLISASVFKLSVIKELIINNNEIEFVPNNISLLTSLEKLNLGHNKLRCIPSEIGRIVSLKELYLNNNLITTVPMEMGCLHNLTIFNLANNPLIAPFNSLAKDKTLITFCREHNTAYSPPMDRAWVDSLVKNETESMLFSVGSFNILCNFFASKLTYAPSWVINPELRKEMIIQTIESLNVDILALQEIEESSYNDFYKKTLELKLHYRSVFMSKSSSLVGVEKTSLPGCCIFWRDDLFMLVETIQIDFQQILASDQRFSQNSDILARTAKKDNIALATVLLSTEGEHVCAINAHLYWNPEYADVKLFQCILVLEEIEKLKTRYPGMHIIFVGDFNSLPDSSVYNLITKMKTDGKDFNLFDYGPYNTGYKHSSLFKDAYINQELTFTNFTPTFKGIIDYIFYSSELQICSVLSEIEDEYTQRTVGLPNIHFPSDHIFIGARFSIKKRK
ncbi:CCR4-NOT transcription complex subunit 6 [Enteropsectra breve]|nr:CCR4-NOT transcription complex subunit 6 [Enteropsectra breve]